MFGRTFERPEAIHNALFPLVGGEKTLKLLCERTKLSESDLLDKVIEQRNLLGDKWTVEVGLVAVESNLKTTH